MATVAVSLFVSCQKQEFVETQDDSKNELSMVDKAKEFVIGQYAQTKSDGPNIMPPSPYSDLAWERAIVVCDEWGTAVNIPINNTTLDFSFYNEYTNKFVKRTDAKQDLVYIRKVDDSGSEIEESYLVTKIYRNPSAFILSPIMNANFELSGNLGFEGDTSYANPFSGLIFWHRSDGSIHRISEYGNGVKNFSMTYSKPKNINPLDFSLMDTQPDIVIMRTEPSYKETWEDGCCVVIGQYTSNGTNFNLVRQFAMLQFMLQYSDGGGSATGEVGMGGGIGGGGNGYATTTTMWDEETHDIIIDKFSKLATILSPSEIAAIKAGSVEADKLKYQTAEYNYMHAMRTNGESLEITMTKLENYFSDKIGEFRGSYGFNKYNALGMALHPIMDAYAPAHAGFPEFSFIRDILDHRGENFENYPREAYSAVSAIYWVYLDAINMSLTPREIFNRWLMRHTR